MPARNDHPYDFLLTVDGVELKLLLDEDPESGLKLWREGMAPMVTPQFRTQRFSYEHVPPEIDLPYAFESWHIGSGYDDVATQQDLDARGDPDASGLATHKYAHSQGVDLSRERRVFLSPAPQTLLTTAAAEVGATPTAMADTLYGAFVGAGQYIYEVDPTNQEVVERYDNGSGTCRSIVELDGILYAAFGTAGYAYSNNGVSWSKFSDTEETPEFFAVRRDVLWLLDENGNVKNTTDGQISGVAWSAADGVGHTSQTVSSFVEADDKLFIFKKEGFFGYDGSSDDDIFTAPVLTTENGKNAHRARDGQVYVPYGNELLAYDPLGDTAFGVVYPVHAMTNSEVFGEITAITSGGGCLWIAVKNAAGNTYILCGNPADQQWHTITYPGSNTVSKMQYFGPGEVHLENPTLLLDYNGTLRFYILARDGYTPGEDNNYKFEQSGVVYGPWVDYGARAFDKFLNRGDVIAGQASGGNDIRLGYETDEKDNETTFVTATQQGVASSEPTTRTTFNRIRYVTRLRSGSEYNSPEAVGWVLHATANPDRKIRWTPRVVIADGLTLRSGAVDRQSASMLKYHLLRSPEADCTLTDREGNVFIVRVLNAQTVGVGPRTIGGVKRDVSLMDLDIVEVSLATSATEQQLVWGQHNWGAGRVWA